VQAIALGIVSRAPSRASTHTANDDDDTARQDTSDSSDDDNSNMMPTDVDGDVMIDVDGIDSQSGAWTLVDDDSAIIAPPSMPPPADVAVRVRVCARTNLYFLLC
jgi:hypothetical protein